MKNLLFVVSFYVLLSACGSREPNLSKADALKLLKENVSESNYVYNLSTADPDQAKRLVMDTLESKGLIIVNRHPGNFDVGKPLIAFTNAGRKDSLGVSPNEDTEVIIRLADAEISEVTDIKDVVVDGKKFIDIYYVVKYSGLSDFHILEKGDFDKPSEKSSRFELIGDKWTLITTSAEK